MNITDSTSSQSIRFSGEMERMMKTLTLETEASRLSSPTMQPRLDVAACYRQLSKSKEGRLEDVVMRQALELYCSLITPPSSPSFAPPEFERTQQPQSFAASSQAISESDYRYAALRSPIESESPSSVISNPMSDLNRPFSSGDEYLSLDFQQLDYNMSTPSPSASEQGSSDSDDMDDPFASYTMPHQRGSAVKSRTSSGNKPDQHRQTYLGVPGINGVPPLPFAFPNRPAHRPMENLTGDAMHRSQSALSHTNNSQARVQGRKSSMSGKPVPRHKSITASKRADAAQPLFQHEGIHPSLYIVSGEHKPSGRKRAFSVATIGLHRKTLSTPLEPHAMSISGPIPIANTKPLKTSKLTPRPAVDQCISTSTARPSLSDHTGINPSAEATHSTIPMEVKLQRNLIKTFSNVSHVEPPINKSPMKTVPRRDSRSLWKSLKTKTSRRSVSIDRFFEEL